MVLGYINFVKLEWKTKTSISQRSNLQMFKFFIFHLSWAWTENDLKLFLIWILSTHKETRNHTLHYNMVCSGKSRKIIKTKDASEDGAPKPFDLSSSIGCFWWEWSGGAGVGGWRGQHSLALATVKAWATAKDKNATVHIVTTGAFFSKGPVSFLSPPAKAWQKKN